MCTGFSLPSLSNVETGLGAVVPSGGLFVTTAGACMGDPLGGQRRCDGGRPDVAAGPGSRSRSSPNAELLPLIAAALAPPPAAATFVPPRAPSRAAMLPRWSSLVLEAISQAGGGAALTCRSSGGAQMQQVC